MKKITLLFVLITALSFNANAQLTEGFEGGTFPPTGWTTFIGTNGLGTAQNWQSTTEYANSGTNSAYVRYENVTGGLAEDWLVTPQLDLASVTDAELRFFSRQKYTDPYGTTYEIRVSTASQTVHADFTTIETWDESTIDNADGLFQQKIVDLSAYDGMQIYVAFVMTQDNGDNWYVDDVTVAPALTCEAPSEVYADFLTDVSLDFSWNLPDTGTPAGYQWEIVADGAGQGNSILSSGSTVAPVMNDGSGNVLTPSTDYDFFIRTNCGSGGFSDWLGPVNFTTAAVPPPSNDVCNGAITVTHETNVANAAAATPTPGTVANAFNANIPAVECSQFIGDPFDDVWYSFTAVTTDVTVTADLYFDGVLVLYSGTCDNLTYINCADDTANAGGGTPVVEEITATGLTVGDTYYARLYNFQDVQPANPTFDIKVWTASTLSVDNFENETDFSYFPNPVKHTLSLRAQNTIQNISVYNLLGQEVLRTTPNAVENEMDMSTLQTGAYFVNVTINDITKTIRIVKQ